MAGVTISSNSYVIHMSFPDDYHRLHVGNRYIWMTWHNYCGPAFYTDYHCSKPYEPKDENDPVWDAFGKWFDKRKKKD